MEYHLFELLFYFFTYAFLGWCGEVAVMAFRTGKFCNRGFLNIPLCPSYGVAMVVLVVLLPTMGGNYLLQFFFCVIAASSIEVFAGHISQLLAKTNLRNIHMKNVFGGQKRGVLYALLLGAGVMCVALVVHPLLFLLGQIIPALVLEIGTLLLSGLLLLDFASVFYATRCSRFALEKKEARGKAMLGRRLANHVWGRLRKAYPGLAPLDTAGEKNRTRFTFAKGLCLDKLIWMFLLCAFIGDIIETLFVRYTAGVWMSRSSLLYGPFSVVWGLGAVLLTVVLERLADKPDRYIFLGGFFLGGAFEYLCSVFTEVFLGTVFWDYSHMPFNIGGRTNLLFCVFWGVLGLVWVKLCYPYISKWIEKIPPLIGKITTWVLVVVMACNMTISALAMARYVARNEGAAAAGVVDTFLDFHYPDELVEVRWQNMMVTDPPAPVQPTPPA